MSTALRFPDTFPAVASNPLQGAFWLIASIALSTFAAVVHGNVVPLPSLLFQLLQFITLVTALVLLGQWLRALRAMTHGIWRLAAWLLMMAFASCAAYMASGAFSKHDEIYSWNLWAIEHFQRQPYDMEYTQAVYPQAFAYWIASIYAAQGQFVVQWVARLAASLPVLLLLTVASGAWRPDVSKRATILGLGITVAALLATYRDLLMGYADPLRSAALVASVAALLRYAQDTRRIAWLYASVGAAVFASYTKQPAVLWVGASLPMIALAGVIWWGWPWRAFAIVVVGAALAGFGAFVVSAGMTDNQGVISRALGEGGVWQALASSVNSYLIKRPLNLVLLLGSWWAVRRIPWLHMVWWLAMLPMMGLWFTLGSYESRHGIHCIWLAAVLWLTALYRVPKGATEDDTEAPFVAAKPSHAVLPEALGVVMVLLVIGVVTSLGARHKGTDMRDGQKSAFARQMGNLEAHDLFERLVGERAHVFVTSNYSWGLFYGRLPLYRATDHDDHATDSLARMLVRVRADYAISAGSYAYGPHSERLLKLVALCPEGLSEMMASVDEHFRVFAVHQEALNACETETLNAP